MLRSLIGAAIGSKLAKRYPVLGGTTGVIAASAVPFVIKRLSIPTMIVMGAGGYLAKRYFDGKDDGGAGAKPTDGPNSDTGTVIDNPPGGATRKAANGSPPAMN
jgi:hypothetical protein